MIMEVSFHPWAFFLVVFPNYNKTFQETIIRNHSRTLVGGLMQKVGALNIFDPCKMGALKKNYHKFSSENWVCVNMLFYGVDP